MKAKAKSVKTVKKVKRATRKLSAVFSTSGIKFTLSTARMQQAGGFSGAYYASRTEIGNIFRVLDGGQSTAKLVYSCTMPTCAKDGRHHGVAFMDGPTLNIGCMEFAKPEQNKLRKWAGVAARKRAA